MAKINFKTYLEGIKNDIKIAVDDIFAVLEKISDDVELLKVKASKPDKHAAALLLDYLDWEEGKSKKNLEKICGEEIAEYMRWVDYYCEKEGTTREQALDAVIKGEI